jgi:hypothetical protein
MTFEGLHYSEILIQHWEACIRAKFWCYLWEGCMWSKQCSVEFGHQLSICSGIEENHGKPWSSWPVTWPSGYKLTIALFKKLRHYATSRKVAGLFPDEVIVFLNSANRSSLTMALRSTQILTEMSTRILSGGKGRPARKADNLIAICEMIAYKMWEPRRSTTLWVSTACYRDNFTIFLYVCFTELFCEYFGMCIKQFCITCAKSIHSCIYTYVDELI